MSSKDVGLLVTILFVFFMGFFAGAVKSVDMFCAPQQMEVSSG